MPEHPEQKLDSNSISVRISRKVYDEIEDYREDLRRQRRPRPTRGALLEMAWELYRTSLTPEEGEKTPEPPVLTDVPAELFDLVEEFIRFVTKPTVGERVWSKHTVEILKERIEERKKAGKDSK